MNARILPPSNFSNLLLTNCPILNPPHMNMRDSHVFLTFIKKTNDTTVQKNICRPHVTWFFLPWSKSHYYHQEHREMKILKATTYQRLRLINKYKIFRHLHSSNFIVNHRRNSRYSAMRDVPLHVYYIHFGQYTHPMCSHRPPLAAGGYRISLWSKAWSEDFTSGGGLKGFRSLCPWAFTSEHHP